MKRLYLLLISLFLFNSCYSQRLSEQQLTKISERDLFIKQTAMNLNNVRIDSCDSLPNFFLNSNYDRSVGYIYWLSNHATISLRKLILDKINNRALLECVIQSKDSKLLEKTIVPENAGFSYNKVPYQEYSMLELVKLRIEELENLQKLGKGQN